MISIKYVVESLDMGIVVHKKISGRIVKLYKNKTTTIFLTFIRFTTVKNVKSTDIISL